MATKYWGYIIYIYTPIPPLSATLPVTLIWISGRVHPYLHSKKYNSNYNYFISQMVQKLPNFYFYADGSKHYLDGLGAFKVMCPFLGKWLEQ